MNNIFNSLIISLSIAIIFCLYCSIIFWAVAETPELPLTLLVYSSPVLDVEEVLVVSDISDSFSLAVVEVAYLPLSMRFLLVAGDIVENETVEMEDLSNTTSWDEIGLNDKLKEHYNLLDRSYKKQCSRSLYGYPYYVWRHDYNDLVKPNVVKQGNTVSANCMLVPNHQTVDNLPNRRNGFAYPSNGYSVKYYKALEYKVLQLTEVDVDSSDLENDAVPFYSLNLDLIDTLFT